jgi:hypothetical protein
VSIEVKQPVILACLFIWIGFVSGISFLEAWLKFRAPGVTLSVGLGIGRLVFNALNKIEWLFVIVICANVIINSDQKLTIADGCLVAAIIILALQTIWLLPALDARADLYMKGQAVPASRLHIFFIIAEILKVTGLFITAVSLFNKTY